MKTEKAKLIFVIVASVIACVLLAVSFSVLAIINKKLDAPEFLKVLEYSDGTFLQVPNNNSADSYIFSIEEEGASAFEISSRASILDISSYVVVNRTYNFKAAYGGQIEYAKSDYCEVVTKRFYKKLQAPHLTYNELTNKLVWQSVYGADFYKLNYKAEDTQLLNLKIESEEDVIEVNLYNMPVGGIFTFSVIACSKNPEIMSSPISNQIVAEVMSTYQTPQFYSKTPETKEILIRCESEPEAFDIWVDTVYYTYEIGDLVLKEKMYPSGFLYTIKLDLLYQEGRTIKIICSSSKYYRESEPLIVNL